MRAAERLALYRRWNVLAARTGFFFSGCVLFFFLGHGRILCAHPKTEIKLIRRRQSPRPSAGICACNSWDGVNNARDLWRSLDRSPGDIAVGLSLGRIASLATPRALGREAAKRQGQKTEGRSRQPAPRVS